MEVSLYIPDDIAEQMRQAMGQDIARHILCLTRDTAQSLCHADGDEHGRITRPRSSPSG
jgi:hypothetical protein